MLTLEPMSATLFTAYIEEATAHFAQEYIEAGYASANEAKALCRSLYATALPQGIATPNQYLYELRHSDMQTIGMVWLSIRNVLGKPSAFIADLYIRPQWRRQGYGTQTLLLIERMVIEQFGLADIGLHVFWHNQAARALYEKMGYRPTSINMLKTLKKE